MGYYAASAGMAIAYPIIPKVLAAVSVKFLLLIDLLLQFFLSWICNGHACRSRIISHRYIFRIGSKRIRYFEHASGIRTIQHGNRKNNNENATEPQPIGHPGTNGYSQLFHCYHLRKASVSTIIPALNCAISSEEIFSSSIRTGIRCCTFTKFPAELSVDVYKRQTQWDKVDGLRTFQLDFNLIRQFLVLLQIG